MLQRPLQRRNYLLPGRFNGTLALGPKGTTGDCFRPRVNMVSVQQSPGQQAHSACVVHVRRHKTSGRLQIGKQRRALAHLLKIVNLQIDVSFARDGQQVQHCVSRSAGCSHGCDRIFECIARKDFSRTDSLLQQIQYYLAAVESNLVLLRIHRGNAVEAHGRKADHLHHGGHGVCGVLASAGAGAGTGHVFKVVQFLVGNLPGGIRPHSFKHILDRDIFAAIAAGSNGPAIKNKSGKIHAG